MVSADEALSIVAAALYLILLGHFAIRFARSRWWIYFFIAFFCALRVVAYVLRAYVDSDAVEYYSNQWISLYITEVTLLSVGVVFILMVLARLYQSILPKLRHQNSHPRGMFETTLVNRTRLFLLPIIACVIAGAVLATPDNSESLQNTGLTLRKVAVLGLLAVGLMFLYAAWNYRNRYPEGQKAFNITLTVTALFVVSLVYKIVYTFKTDVQTTVWAFFVFSPLLELAALCVLAGDLQTVFLGRKEDKIPKDEENELH
ncbi:hypothetical protein EDD21DRAFT_366983 [Dissophora ornata]|nr:hypothetical protein BGZ58_004366 [Dissophora ornata]KAI8604162.1 hypothetical protein EDD21DRAFT_366983 [Dissophora ornata]